MLVGISKKNLLERTLRTMPFPARSSTHLEAPVSWTGLGSGFKAPLSSA